MDKDTGTTSCITATAVRIARNGGPEVIEIARIELPEPGPGQVLLRQTAIGLNYQDVYMRNGPSATLPQGLGMEAAGEVVRVGPDVTDLRPGDRVAYGGVGPGSYADHRVVPASRLVRVPDGISDETAAAVLMKGMTVEYLLERCVKLQAGQTALVYAASGGVGLIAGQWGRNAGARMIGVAGGAEKVRLALAAGYDAVIDRTSEDVVTRVKALTGGKGVAVAYDSVGRATFDATLSSLAQRGIFVSFGATTGAVPPVDAGALLRGGSLYFTRPTLQTYIAAREDLLASAKAVFDRVEAGILSVTIGQRFALADAAAAHRALEAGTTIGSTILLP